ncbi:MAG: DinB family protein [Chloroflexi bacterium]|nr:DinB family protein [Chloroflexota bacterium]
MTRERQEKLTAYRQGAQQLVAMVAGVPQDAWSFKPSQQDWSIAEIIVHLTDLEANHYVRFRTVTVRPGALIQGVDADEWANALQYGAQDAAMHLQLFTLLRQANYDLLRQLPDSVWEHPLEHSERGHITLEQLFNGQARHIAAHMEQIEKTLGAWRQARS